MTRQNISEGSPAQVSGRLRHMGNFGRRELTPEEIIRLVKERYRLVRYLVVLAAIWVIAGGLLYFFWLGFDYDNPRWPMLYFVVQTVGIGIMTVALVVKFATYRCPVCDHGLSRKLKDKTHCPNCNAQVKESA